MENDIYYADAVSTPYSPEEIISVAYNLVFKTGIFNDDYKLWKRK